MTEKEKLLNNLIEKTGKSIEELEKLISSKINELSGLVSDEGAIYIIANELGIRLDTDRPKRDIEFEKIEKITESKVPISLECKVIRKYDKINFSSANGNEGSVQSILVGDETGIMRIVFWQDKTEVLENIQEKDTIRIINAYTRENNQNSKRIEVHYGQYSDIEVNPKGLKIEVAEFVPQEIELTSKKISEIEDNDKNIKVKGIVTDFDIPRFYLACPECFKKVHQDDGNFECAQHNEVEAVKVPIVNLIVDDGSSTIAVVGFRDRAEKITGFNSDEIIALTQDINKYRNFSKRIIGANIEIGGNIGINSMSGENQILSNQILSINLKNIEEITKELVNESEIEDKKIKEKKLDKELDLDDIDIEEIDIDDDML